MKNFPSTWLAHVHDPKDAKKVRPYEATLQQFLRLRKEGTKEQVLERVKQLERLTLGDQAPASERQQGRFFYHAGCIYMRCGRLALANETFSLCQRRVRCGDLPAMYRLHLAWAQVADALRLTLSACRSFNVVVTETDRLGLLRGRNYRYAVQRLTVLYSTLTRTSVAATAWGG